MKVNNYTAGIEKKKKKIVMIRKQQLLILKLPLYHFLEIKCYAFPIKLLYHEIGKIKLNVDFKMQTFIFCLI